MADDFLTKLIGSAARARILRVFILGENESFTQSLLAKRASVSSATAAKEIKVLEQWDVIKKGKFSIILSNGTKRAVAGNQKESAWMVNPDFKYLRPLSMFIHEISPVRYESIVAALRRTGRLSAVVISGSFMGDLTRPADLIVAGDGLNESRLEQAVRALEAQFGREIRYAAFSTPEFRYRLTIQDRLIRDTLDYPHLVLLDKAKVL